MKLQLRQKPIKIGTVSVLSVSQASVNKKFESVNGVLYLTLAEKSSNDTAILVIHL